MRGLAERDAVQGIGARAGGQCADDGVGECARHAVKGGGAFNALGQVHRPGGWEAGAGALFVAAKQRPGGGSGHVVIRTHTWRPRISLPGDPRV